MPLDPNASAFPIHSTQQPGLTVRAYIAIRLHESIAFGHRHHHVTADQIARETVQAADALIAALNASDIAAPTPQRLDETTGNPPPDCTRSAAVYPKSDSRPWQTPPTGPDASAITAQERQILEALWTAHHDKTGPGTIEPPADLPQHVFSNLISMQRIAVVPWEGANHIAITETGIADLESARRNCTASIPSPLEPDDRCRELNRTAPPGTRAIIG